MFQVRMWFHQRDGQYVWDETPPMDRFLCELFLALLPVEWQGYRVERAMIVRAVP